MSRKRCGFTTIILNKVTRVSVKYMVEPESQGVQVSGGGVLQSVEEGYQGEH